MKQLHIRQHLLLLFITLLAVIPAGAKKYTATTLERPNKFDANNYIADPTGQLSETYIQRINTICNSLRELTTAEMAVAIVPEIDTTIEEFASDLFREWGVGKKDKDNGILVVVVTDKDRGVRIETGYGIESIVTDVVAKRVLEEDFIPIMKENGDLDKALYKLTAHLSDILLDPDVANEIMSSEPAKPAKKQPGTDFSPLYLFILALAGCAWVITLVYYIILRLRARRQDNYAEAQKLHSAIPTLWTGTIFSLGLGILFPLLARRRIKHLRQNPRTCPHCGGKMIKLSPLDHYTKLTPSEDLEEQLESVNYDVWECEQCQNVEKLAFPSTHTKYKRCPNCGTVAVDVVADHVLVVPTTQKEGVGDRVWECRYCGHERHEKHKIAEEISDSGYGFGSGGGSGFGGGGGGGGGGGSFGGGGSGGGGASSHW